MLFSGEMKSILEVLRALGNFTQHKVVRDALIKTSCKLINIIFT